MAVGCGANFAKVILIIFNIIFLATGVVLIAVGIWLLVTLAQNWGPSAIFQLATGSYLYRNAAILLIAMGCLILFVTILGIVAAVRESVPLLIAYLVFLFIIFAGEIAGGVVAIVYKDKLIKEAQQILTDSLDPVKSNLQYYYKVGVPCATEGLPFLWDTVQNWMDCCGISDYYDGYDKWNKTTLNQCNATLAVWPQWTQKPLTCCGDFNVTKFDHSHQENFVSSYNCNKPRTQGCFGKIQNFIVKYSPILIGIGIGFGMFEMFGVIFVVCLCMNTDKSFKRF